MARKHEKLNHATGFSPHDLVVVAKPQAVVFAEDLKIRKIFPSGRRMLMLPGKTTHQKAGMNSPSSHREGLLERLGIAVSQNGGRRWSRFPMETLRKVPSLRSELNFTRGAGMIKSDRW
ncbi:MAG: hypothetical protein ACYCT9_09080 [Leptospirillum sp.]